MSDTTLCGTERDVNASPDSTVEFSWHGEVETKSVAGNSVGRIDSSKITRSVSQYQVATRLYQRAELTEIFFVPIKVEPIKRWQPAVKGTAKNYAGILRPKNTDAKPVSRSRLDEILHSMRNRVE